MRSEYDSLDVSFLDKKGIKIGYRLNSKISKGFIVEQDRIKRRMFLSETFQLENKLRFEEKYEEASTGSGQPYKDFDALRSSALCALLSFYNIDDLEIDGVHYSNAFFEVQNIVIPGEKPSNMDVVLVSNDKKTILFLECKFSEYLSNCVQNVSIAYLSNCELSNKLYKLLTENNIAKIKENGQAFSFYTKEAYSQGTKQVISHLVGISSFLKKDKTYLNNFKFYGENDKRKELYSLNFENVIFQEVLFDLEGYEDKLNAYLSLSEKVRLLFNESNLIKNITFKPATTYQKLFEGNNRKNVDALVAKFYKYK